MLGAAQPDAFGAHFARQPGIARRVRVRTHPQSSHFIGPFQQCFIGFRRLRANQVNVARVNRSVAAIERDPFAFANGTPAGRHLFCARINVNFFRANDAALSPTARHHGGVARLTACRRKYPLRDIHAADIFRASLAPYQNHFLSARGPGFRFLRGEYGLTNRGSRDGVDSFS